MNVHFLKSVNFSPSYGNSSFKKHGFFRKKLNFYFFSKNNQFEKKSLMETESLFERAISLYLLFFNFRILKFDV